MPKVRASRSEVKTTSLAAFASQLRAWRQRSGWTQVELGTKMGYSASLISLGVTSSTILRWTQLGLLTIAAPDNRGFGLYQPGQPRPTRDQITTACRPPGTGDAITGGQLAARHGVSRSAVYKWHQLGLIDSLGTDGTGRNLYHPGQQAPSREQIRTARAARRHGAGKCQTPVPSSVPEGRTPPITIPGTGSSTRGAV